MFVDHDSVCIAGILLSVYALYVEIRKKRDANYVAVCDLGDNMQCSRVLTSEYSTGFGIVQHLVGKESFLNVPNCVCGIVVYSIQLVLGHMTWIPWVPALLHYMAWLGCLASLYLAYILTFVLKDLCLVCLSTYVVNFLLLFTTRAMYV